MNDECWLEMDLYWFQGGEPDAKAAELIDRLAPLWIRAGSAARKGLSLCVGWLSDPVLCWNGDLDAVIPTCQAPTYEPWTYRRLGELIATIKRQAARRGIDRLHVAMMMIGTKTMEMTEGEGFSGRTEQRDSKPRYHIRGRWLNEHPEAYDPARFDPPFFGATIDPPADERVCRENRPTLAVYFADKVCSLAEAIGLDGVVLRDGFFTPAYVRGNPRGRYMDPAARRDWNAGLAALFARIKRNRPQLVTIGYSSGISPVEEWRSHGFDLEQLARSGNLDLWITQTWGSAWQDYWPQQSSGFTFQLADVLVHLAMLQGTPRRHLFLIETFDAWEPWDSIHQYPSKVAWEIWAYSHAAVLRGNDGIGRSSGTYISWMNRREELLPGKTVQWLVRTMDGGAADLAGDPRPAGPCLVYHRAGLEHLLDQGGELSRGEEMDDWTAMLLKFGLPVLSIVRSEDAPATTADAYILAAPAAIDERMVGWIGKRAAEGTPFLLLGEASSFDQRLRLALNIELQPAEARDVLPTGARIIDDDLAQIVGTRGLVINQRRRTLAASPRWQPLIETLGGPVSARHRELPVWLWEPPQWGTLLELNVTWKTIQSVQTYMAVVASFGRRRWGAGRVGWANLDRQNPVCFLAWNYPDGSAGVLLGNLETGFTGNSQNSVKGKLETEVQMRLKPVDPRWAGRVRRDGGHTVVTLLPHGSCVIDLAAT